MACISGFKLHCSPMVLHTNTRGPMSIVCIFWVIGYFENFIPWHEENHKSENIFLTLGYMFWGKKVR